MEKSFLSRSLHLREQNPATQHKKRQVSLPKRAKIRSRVKQPAFGLHNKQIPSKK